MNFVFVKDKQEFENLMYIKQFQVNPSVELARALAILGFRLDYADSVHSTWPKFDYVTYSKPATPSGYRSRLCNIPGYLEVNNLHLGITKATLADFFKGLKDALVKNNLPLAPHSFLNVFVGSDAFYFLVNLNPKAAKLTRKYITSNMSEIKYVKDQFALIDNVPSQLNEALNTETVAPANVRVEVESLRTLLGRVSLGLTSFNIQHKYVRLDVRGVNNLQRLLVTVPKDGEVHLKVTFAKEENRLNKLETLVFKGSNVQEAVVSMLQPNAFYFYQSLLPLKEALLAFLKDPNCSIQHDPTILWDSVDWKSLACIRDKGTEANPIYMYRFKGLPYEGRTPIGHNVVLAGSNFVVVVDVVGTSFIYTVEYMPSGVDTDYYSAQNYGASAISSSVKDAFERLAEDLRNTNEGTYFSNLVKECP